MVTAIRQELRHSPPMGPKAYRSYSISDVSSFSSVSVLSFDPVRVSAQCVGEPQFGCSSSVMDTSITTK